MCGIAGYVAPDVQQRRGDDGAMLAAVAYRGPDARTTWSDGTHAVLQHARLSIIDLECGGQPMTDSTGRFTIVFNGAIYNYPELRRQYEQLGAVFHTNSDTEVLLNGFALKRERVLADLNGMFAFAIWDAADRRLFMARDRLGKKPLFWTRIGDTLAFASSIAAFRRMRGWNDTPSAAGLVLYSFLGGFPVDTTAFAAAKALPPGHFAWYAPGDASPQPSRYWLPAYHTKNGARFDQQLEEYETLLEDAIRLRLRSDVPVALSFSGGVDSGSIAALAKTRCNADLQCYTIDYDGPDSNSAEVAMARQVAAQLGLTWQHINYDYRAELLEGLDTAYRDFDQPAQQLALVYSRRLYDVMGRQCRVVLSGNGADELFTGYRGDEAQWSFDRQRRWLRRIPEGLYRRVSEARRSHWNHVRLDQLTIDQWARRDMMAYAQQFSSDVEVLEQCRHTINQFCDQIADAGIDSQMDFVMHRALTVSTADTNYRLPDITGYAAAVEVRSPFLDYRMVEFSARLPHRFKVGRHQQRLRAKFLPRRSYERLVGADIAWAPKRGMGDNLNWQCEFVSNPKFQEALERSFRQLPIAGIDARPFDLAYQQFLASVSRGDRSFPSAGTMMNGFMLGAWIDRVFLPGAPASNAA